MGFIDWIAKWSAPVRFVREVIAARRFARKMRSLPPSTLANLAESMLGRVEGTVHASGPLLQSPLTGRPCVYWCVRVDAVIAGGGLEAMGEAADCSSFMLADGSERAIVMPDNAKISVDFDVESESKAAFDASVMQRELLERFGARKRDWFIVEKIRYREAVISVGDLIRLGGAGVREPNLDAAGKDMYRSEAPTRLCFVGSARYPLVIEKPAR